MIICVQNVNFHRYVTTFSVLEDNCLTTYIQYAVGTKQKYYKKQIFSRDISFKKIRIIYHMVGCLTDTFGLPEILLDLFHAVIKRQQYGNKLSTFKFL